MRGLADFDSLAHYYPSGGTRFRCVGVVESVLQIFPQLESDKMPPLRCVEQAVGITVPCGLFKHVLNPLPAKLLLAELRLDLDDAGGGMVHGDGAKDRVIPYDDERFTDGQFR